MNLGRPSRLTPENLKLLQEQAALWERVMSLKEIARATGFSRTYCHTVMLRFSGKKTVSKKNPPDTLGR